MLIRVEATFYVDTDDPEHTCTSLDRGLLRAVAQFPDGEILQADVERYNVLTGEEIHELGLDDE